MTVFVGTGLSLAGNAINEGVGTIDGKPSVLVEQALSNHFSDALRLRFTGSLGLDYNKEVFATFAYGKYNGTERIVGSVSGYPLRLRLSNADAFDFEGGLRYYLRPEGPIRTYVAGAAGLRYLQATDATFRVVEVGLTSGQPAVLQGIGAVHLRWRCRCQLRRIRHDRGGGGARASVPGQARRRAALCGSEPPGRQRHGQPLVASDQRLREGAVLMQAHESHHLFIVRPRTTRLRRHSCGRVAGIARRAGLECSRMGRAQVAGTGVHAPATPAARTGCRQWVSAGSTTGLARTARAGGPETLPLLAGLLGDAEIDIREGAVAGVIGVYVPPRANRSINAAAALRGRAVPCPAMVGPS